MKRVKMKLLRDIQTEGFPCDYLYARIRSRRSELGPGSRNLWSESGDPQVANRAEYVWLYTQMNRRSRHLLLPVFEYFELRVLVIGLRYLAAGDCAAMIGQLRSGLLHPQVFRLLQKESRIAEALAGLERLLATEQPYFHGLAEIYLQQGPGGVEQSLIGGCLQQGSICRRSRQVREFLRYLLDMRNLLALYKHLYWQVPVSPPLLTGGTLDLSVFEKIWKKKDLAGLLIVMGQRADIKGHPEAEGVEEFLFRGLSASLKRQGRKPLQLGLILDYLWRCQVKARNLGLDMAGVELSADLPAVEASK